MEGKIYKIFNVNPCVDNEFYIGSTFMDTIEQRFYQHQNGSCYNHKSTKSLFHDHMRETGLDNFKVELIETYKCKNKTELRKRERYWCEQLNPILNQKLPYISDDEKRALKKINNEKFRKSSEGKNYFAKYRDEHRDYFKQYNELHKDKRKQYMKKYMAKQRLKQKL